ncbi:major facilitator superfamily transporter [Mollisia scopiformis]|uniref:Major facilitator superfamily transporter n=1 Tax=Mollisia scopiformis TaxID=149040 RepID=A0A132BDI5_MOLSC|nr:major facilitator superfamily transporter [Mollisia scopiformis]KUJ09727.1 major facilitator superfamily transporter [Mollisia scopiformis]
MASDTSSNTSKRESRDLNGSVYLISSDGRVLSLPIPTRSHRDPLNWSARKRAGAVLALLFYSVTGLVVVQGPSLMFKPLAIEFTLEETKPFPLTALLSAPTLFMGFGAFLWIPLTLALGRRPVFLLCTVLLTLSTIWAGIAGSFYQMLAATCLQGLAEGFSTSTILLMIIDLTFIHQRPQAIAMVWSVVGFITGSIFSLVPQMTNAGTNWRSFYLIWIIPCSISIVLAFFLFPETYFIRPALAFDGRIVVQGATEKVEIYESWEEVPGGKELPDTPGQNVWGYTNSELRIWGKTRGGWTSMFACYPQVFLCLINPLVFWVALLSALVLACMLSIGETYAAVLSAPPYSLPIHVTALVNLAGAVGSLIAWPASGILISWISRRLAINNRGVRDAEHYLPAFILPVLGAVASVVLYGLTAEWKWNSIWVYVSYALNSFAFASLATASTLWITEAFPRWAAPAVVVVFGLSYMASFGLSFSIMPWVQSQGYAGSNIELGLMILIVGCIGMPVAFWGKRLRQYIHGKYAFHEEGALRPH